MKNYRLYGKEPYSVVTVHGGPGAPGSLGYVSDFLSADFGVVEALQTKQSVTELVEELAAIIEEHCPEPATLIGHSWGAWLAYLTAAAKPELVSKLVLVGSGPFLAEYAKEIEPARMRRLSENDRAELPDLFKSLRSGSASDPDTLMSRIGRLIEKADTYCPNEISEETYLIKVDGSSYGPIWSEAAAMRRSGELLNLAANLTCPVYVIHGDYDPHPVAGVIKPLSERIPMLKSFVLEKSGHSPWKEKYAHDTFFKILSDIIRE